MKFQFVKKLALILLISVLAIYVIFLILPFLINPIIKNYSPQISEELKKVDSAESDESCILYKEMQLMAMNNMQRFKLGLKK